MKAHFIALFLASLPVLPGVASADEGLTLQRALDEVLAQYPSLEAARAGIDAAEGRTLQARSARLPQIAADAGYRYTNPLSYVDFATEQGTRRIYQQTENNYDVGLNLHQLITDFGRTDALVRAARTGELSSQDALDQLRNTIGYQTVGYFYSVLFLQESVKVADEEIRALQEALRIARQRFDAGSATHFDVLTTQVRLSTAENRRTDTVVALKKQEAQLRQLLGRKDPTPLNVQGDFVTDNATPERSELLRAALAQRPDLAGARHAEAARKESLTAADRSERPSLSATVNAGARNGYAPSLNETKAYVTAGLALDVPIFTGRKVEGQRREARADLRAAEQRVLELERTVATELDSALADLTASSARLQNADALVEQAREALKLAQSRYERGVVTNFELLDAQSAARGAELARIQARFDRVLAAQAVSRATGRKPSA